jgi:hypothetical protein
MKLVQIGILVALIAVGALLFMVYRGQHQQQPVAAEPSTQQSPPAETSASASSAADETPATKKAPESRPSPASGEKRASKPVTPPSPAEAPVTPPQTQVAAAASEPAVSPAPVSPAPASAPSPAPIEPPPPPQPRTVTIQPGALLSARLGETLSTEKAQTGDTFTATLDKPLVVEGMVIAERGARAEGRVEEAVQAGRLRGLASLSIRLVRLQTADGQSIDIQTDAFHKEGESTKRQDAAKVGGTASATAAMSSEPSSAPSQEEVRELRSAPQSAVRQAQGRWRLLAGNPRCSRSRPASIFGSASR